MEQQQVSVSGSGRSPSSSSSSNVVSEGEQTTPGVEIKVNGDTIQKLDCGRSKTAGDGGHAGYDREAPENDDNDEDDQKEEDDMWAFSIHSAIPNKKQVTEQPVQRLQQTWRLKTCSHISILRLHF
ncbi:hypothetical protein ATANTOWER_024373 [Ataeniobius toweri]|uniref:Uncharacterized protein n=1 Tax=Ataeniobius toweri TaxID=208326 RepID=A0ABU7A2A5_9TELE|nr:hypothetical protein [Ataeniobius toweri]